MLIIGLEHLLAVSEGKTLSAKMVFNSQGAIFFPTAIQHRDMKAPGISYADNYKGNALAAMIAPGKIEVRFHEAFTDQQVANILHTLADQPGLAFIAVWHATYQGRTLSAAKT